MYWLLGIVLGFAIIVAGLAIVEQIADSRHRKLTVARWDAAVAQHELLMRLLDAR